MDKNQLKVFIEGLKSSSSSRIQDSLLKIRSIISNEKGMKLFLDCGGLNYLLPHLRKPNEKILNITLSILGNVCLDETCSLAIGELNTFAPLVSILNTVCRDSILGRACKLIGNLAQNKSNAEGFHNHGAVQALVTLIEGRDKTMSNPTLTMAVRAIRQLWMVTDKRDEMLNLNVVRCIAILMTTECESMGIMKSTAIDKEIGEIRKSQEELIIGILKCLGYFTTYSMPQCAEQLQGDGRGYQCLVALTKTNETLALKCLMNLCYLSICRPLLGTAGLVECLVNILKKNPDVTWWPDGSDKALAQLSGESVNRSRLRHCGGLPLLVSAARVNNHALHALLQYVFDDTAFQIMISEGLIHLLTEKLTTYVNTMEIEHNLSIESELSEKKHKDNIQTSNSNESTTVRCENTNQNRCNELGDELKVVIERDNMIVGFVDAIGSDRSEDSDDDSINQPSPSRRKAVKRGRISPKCSKKKSKVIKMAKKDWSAGVYWEPKSPEHNSPHFPRMSSPDRSDLSPLSQYSEGNWSGVGPEYMTHCSRRGWDWSPGSASSEGSSTSPHRTDFPWSPSSSGPASPLTTEESSDSEVSGRYSPVCSEGEDEGEGAQPVTSVIDPAQVAHELEELIMDDDESSDETPNEDTNRQLAITKTSGIMCILVLLFRASHGACASGNETRDETSTNTIDLLTRRECMNALLDYVERCRRPTGRAARIIARVLSNSLCLISILKHRFVMRLHTMSMNSKHPPAICRQCKQLLKLGSKLLEQLTIVAESSHGIGEISYHLLKGSPYMKQTLSITLPYIVRTKKILKKYFVDCDALNLLFSTIAGSKENIQICVTALAKLASNVQIKDPKYLEKRYQDFVPISYYDPILDDLSSEDIVTFVLDDQSTVQANKSFLCQHSDVFSIMLTGSFKESTEKCVTIKKVSKQALEYLFTLLQSGLNEKKCNIEIFPLCENLVTNLEVLILADRFLFDNIKGLLCSAIIQFQLTPENVNKIYVWSLGDGMGFLCVEAVAYLLIGQMDEELRIASFKSILDFEYKDQWLEDIKAMLLRHLVK